MSCKVCLESLRYTSEQETGLCMSCREIEDAREEGFQDGLRAGHAAARKEVMALRNKFKKGQGADLIIGGDGPEKRVLQEYARILRQLKKVKP